MKTISLAMIVKNECETLPQCLSSVCNAVDEIIIADTGSTDGTLDAAHKFTDAIYHFKWVGDFAAARNFAFSKATCDYIMWLDADDILTPENTQKLAALKMRLSNEKVITAKYNCTHDNLGNVTLQSIRERIISREYFAVHKWHGEIHEHIKYNDHDNVLHSEIIITHTKNHNPADITSPTFSRNLEILERAVQNGNHTATNMHYYACSLKELRRFDEALFWLKKYFALGNAINPEAYLTAHDIYLEKGDPAAAYKILAENEFAASHMAEYYTALGRFFQKQAGDLQKAGQAYEKALTCMGGDIRNMDYYYFLPYSGLGEVSTAIGDYAAALVHYENALSYKPNEPLALGISEKLRQILRLPRS